MDGGDILNQAAMEAAQQRIPLMSVPHITVEDYHHDNEPSNQSHEENSPGNQTKSNRPSPGNTNNVNNNVKTPSKEITEIKEDHSKVTTPSPLTVSNDGINSEEGGAKEGEENRAAWGGKMEFLFTCIGYAVGLGNVWRFPYLCYKNGGGAFLIPYIFMLAFVGIPVFLLELCFGQFASLGPISIWKINPLFKGLGMAMVASSWMVAVYYNVIIAHVMLFLFASFASVTTQLPWINCQNPWNTPACLEPDYAKESGASSVALNASFANISYSAADMVTTASNVTEYVGKLKTPAEEYYNHFILEITDGIENSGGLNWKLTLCLLLSWIIVLICLIRGIQSLGKVVYFTAIFPYVMLTILLVRGLTLPGASQGIIFYLKPDFSRLADPRVWSDAATQIFYSLGTCCGGLIAMSSYNKFNNNVYRDSLIVSTINCATSLYAGFVIFSILGFMAHEKGMSVAEVATGGPGLAFVVYPEALSRMAAPQLWAILFFFMMATLGFGSQFSMVESVLSAITDEYVIVLKRKWPSIIFRSSVILFSFLMGLPMVSRGGIYLLDLVDYSVSGFPLLVIGMLEIVALAWIYGYEKLSDDVHLMLGRKPTKYFKICWLFVTPAIIMVTIVLNVIFFKPPSYGDSYKYPFWAEFLGWLIALFPISLIVGVYMWRYCKNGGLELTKELNQPTEEWGPYYRQHRTGKYHADLSHQPLEFVDLSGRLYSPRTIMLARTPAGSSFNVAKVSNYTGPIPVVLSMAPDKRRFLTPTSTRRPFLQRQVSQSMNNLEVQGRSRLASGSVPHIPGEMEELPPFCDGLALPGATTSMTQL